MRLIDIIKLVFKSQISINKRIRMGGGKVGNNVDIISSHIDMLSPKLISIGDNVTLSHVNLLVHDASTKKTLGYTKFGKVTIGNNVFVGLGTIILPGVEIGNNVVIGAGSVVSQDIPSDTVAVGAPCKPIASFENYMKKSEDIIRKGFSLDKSPSELSENETDSILKELQETRFYFLR